MIRISETSDEFFNKVFPHLKEKLRMAQMQTDVVSFVFKSFLLSLVFSVTFSVSLFFILSKFRALYLLFPIFIFILGSIFFLALRIPDFNIRKIRTEIENDIFIPSRMLLTLLESGNSIITAMLRVSNSKSKSSKYFGNIVSEIFLGKNIAQAIDDAIKYTPSVSFKRVLEPI